MVFSIEWVEDNVMKYMLSRRGIMSIVLHHIALLAKRMAKETDMLKGRFARVIKMHPDPTLTRRVSDAALSMGAHR
jgi:hypothetical protein